VRRVARDCASRDATTPQPSGALQEIRQTAWHLSPIGENLDALPALDPILFQRDIQLPVYGNCVIILAGLCMRFHRPGSATPGTRPSLARTFRTRAFCTAPSYAQARFASRTHR
jgi:hypothetical protein